MTHVYLVCWMLEFGASRWTDEEKNLVICKWKYKPLQHAVKEMTKYFKYYVRPILIYFLLCFFHICHLHSLWEYDTENHWNSEYWENKRMDNAENVFSKF